MPVLSRMVAAPLHLDVSRGALGRVGEVLADARISRDGRVAIVIGDGVGSRALDALGDDVDRTVVTQVHDGSVEAAIELAERLNSASVDAVVGIGGGRTLDLSKHAATRLGLPMVAVATSLAHDGIASPVSVLRHGDARRSYGVAAPAAVVVDLDFVASAPPGSVRSGVGDVVSNLSAVADWRLAHRCLGERIDGIAIAFASTAAEAVLSQPIGLGDEFLTCLAESLVMSGMAMAAAGTSRPCSGACHEISHAIDHLYPGAASHGEQVGLGALFASFLRDDVRVDALLAAFRQLHLPVTAEDLGLSPSQFIDAVALAPSTRPERFTVLEYLMMDRATIGERYDAYLERVIKS